MTTDHPVDDFLIGLTFGEYELLERIGKGGMGLVYKARQISLDRIVAIKVLPHEMCSDEEYVDRFLREARAAAHLNHPNIIQIFDAGIADATYFFVMEFVDGKNLIQILKEDGVFQEKQALKIIKDAAIGLTFAHQMGVVHRDVKPENIMLTKGGEVKIGDLGLAKYQSAQMDASLTLAGMTMGTPFYIATEQIRGMKDIDGRADIYALGMSLYHILEGKPAFGEGSGAEIMDRHLSSPIPPIGRADVSAATRELIVSMTMKNRDERLQDMSQVAVNIARMLGEEIPHTIASRAMNSPVEKIKKEEKSLIAIILFLFVVITLVGGFIVYKLAKKKTLGLPDRSQVIQTPSPTAIPHPESVPAQEVELVEAPKEEVVPETSSEAKFETSSKEYNRRYRMTTKEKVVPVEFQKNESKPSQEEPKERLAEPSASSEMAKPVEESPR